jgi:acrylyl-CoA reductase (NADPH)
MASFRAFRVYNEEGTIQSRLEEISLDDLNDGEVVIRAAYSDVNYKDALAATGKGKIMHRFPMVGGIDVSGTVVSSADPRFKEGDEVLVAGSALSEDYDGGYSEYVRVLADSVVPLPEGMDLREAMCHGTAGFTAGIAVELMERNGQHPEHGPILVTGATGGVGSIAIGMLAGLGYQVTAYTGKKESEEFLRAIGASEILLRGETDLGTRPLERAIWGGAVDNLGGEVLEWLTRTVKPLGNICAVGLAASIRLNTTVMPFILRGVNLLGTNSLYYTPEFRTKVWNRIASDLRPEHMDRIVTREVSLDALPGVFDEYIAGGVTGRTIVNIGA